MKFFMDECIYKVTTDFLVQSGYDVVTVQQAGLSGFNNGEVLSKAISEQRIFVTRDVHFSNILLFPPQNSFGIIVLKIKPETIVEVHQVLLELINKYSQKDLSQTLIIVDRNKYRIRKVQ